MWAYPLHPSTRGYSQPHVCMTLSTLGIGAAYPRAPSYAFYPFIYPFHVPAQLSTCNLQYVLFNVISRSIHYEYSVYSLEVSGTPDPNSMLDRNKDHVFQPRSIVCRIILIFAAM